MKQKAWANLDLPFGLLREMSNRPTDLLSIAHM